MRRLRDPRSLVLLLFLVESLVAIGWGLPGSDSWAADSISPRSSGLGAIALTYLPGRYHQYPPLHMLVLTIVALPWIAAAALRVGTGARALEQALLAPATMTGIELASRAVTVAMALGTVWLTMRLWTRISGRARVGAIAGAVLATNAPLVYYAHTGNLEVPYLFWVTAALVAIDRVAAGEPVEARALLLATAAVLTKDQTAAAFLLVAPVYVVAVPWIVRRDAGARLPRVARAAGLSVLAYAIASGALVNPRGFRARVALLLGPASQSWTSYPRGLDGAKAIARDALLAVPHFTSWPAAALAVVGIALALSTTRGAARARVAAPLVAAASFTLFFTLGARRTEDRFLLPQSVLLLPYAAIAIDRAIARAAAAAARAWARGVVVALALAAYAPALLGVASIDATLLADSRYAAERFLASLPAGTRVEVLGGSPFLPRVPRDLVAARPGVEPIDERRAIPGIEEIVDPAMDPRPRAPAFVVLATELSSDALAYAPARPPRYGATSYRDPASLHLLRALRDGALGYGPPMRFRCELPPPLACRRIHDSTGEETWIYPRVVPPSGAPLDRAVP